MRVTVKLFIERIYVNLRADMWYVLIVCQKGDKGNDRVNTDNPKKPTAIIKTLVLPALSYGNI